MLIYFKFLRCNEYIIQFKQIIFSLKVYTNHISRYLVSMQSLIFLKRILWCMAKYWHEISLVEKCTHEMGSQTGEKCIKMHQNVQIEWFCETSMIYVWFFINLFFSLLKILSSNIRRCIASFFLRVADSALLLRIRGAFCSTYSQNKPFPPFRQQKYPLSSIFLTIKTSEESYHVKNREKTINTDNTRQYLHETTIPSKHFFSHNTSKEPVLVKIFLETQHYASSWINHKDAMFYFLFHKTPLHKKDLK